MFTGCVAYDISNVPGVNRQNGNDLQVVKDIFASARVAVGWMLWVDSANTISVQHCLPLQQCVQSKRENESPDIK